ncbi:MAG: hypothetical protein WAM11_12615 [Cyanobium sp.]
MLIYACISSHGFGHGSRSVAVLQQLARLRPDWRLVLSTGLPAAFLKLAFGHGDVELRPCRWDVGVVQADALGVDPLATLLALEALDAELPARIEAEVAWLVRQQRPVLVLGDVPPAAALIAARLGAPLVWLANFGWDVIYAAMGPELARHGLAARQLYGEGDLLLRCPLDLPMDWGIPVQPIGLTHSEPRPLAAELLAALALPADRDRCVLISFGGLGLSLDPALLARWPEHVFIGSDPALAEVSNARLLPEGLRPLDLMPYVGRLITKAGYSSFCEAFSQGVGIHLVDRRGFAEAPVLAQALQDHGRHRLLSRSQLDRGDWQLDQPLLEARQGPLPGAGAEAAAAAIVALLAR